MAASWFPGEGRRAEPAGSQLLPGEGQVSVCRSELEDAGSLSSDTYTISKRKGADGRIVYHHLISSEHFSLGRFKWDKQSC